MQIFRLACSKLGEGFLPCAQNNYAVPYILCTGGQILF